MLRPSRIPSATANELSALPFSSVPSSAFLCVPVPRPFSATTCSIYHSTLLLPVCPCLLPTTPQRIRHLCHTATLIVQHAPGWSSYCCHHPLVLYHACVPPPCSTEHHLACPATYHATLIPVLSRPNNAPTPVTRTHSTRQHLSSTPIPRRTRSLLTPRAQTLKQEASGWLSHTCG